MKIAIAAIALLGSVAPAIADYPERPVRIILSLAPGSVDGRCLDLIAGPGTSCPN